MAKKKINQVEVVDQNIDVPIFEIENMIFNFRGVQVMLDRDLAMLYGVTTSRLNEQVKRNIARFPESFRFQLTSSERDELVAKCDNLQTLKFSPSLPYVFTEQGIAQLSSVLRTPVAIEMSVKIMNAFVSMRRFLISNAVVFQRLELLEKHQLKTDARLDEVFKRIDTSLPPMQGIFFEGQVFDAYTFISDLIRRAKKKIVLFDNYIDDRVLTMLDKRRVGVSVQIYTRNISHQLALDISKHDAQYPPFTVKEFQNTHDRFLCIDDAVYHIGASLKDLGKKWFAFSKMEVDTETLIQRL